MTTWNGATAKVVVSAGTNISSVEIINGGSNYSAGTYYLDTSVIGTGNNNAFTVVTSGITPGVGHVFNLLALEPEQIHITVLLELLREIVFLLREQQEIL